MDIETSQVVANSVVTTYSTLWVFQAVATITLILRIISRSFITRDIGWEDTIMAFGWAVNLAGTIVMTISINAIIHIADATDDYNAALSNSLKLSLIAAALVPNAMWLPKISVALLLTRLLQPGPWTKGMLIVPSIIGFIGGGICSAIVTFVQCNPVAGQWEPERYHPTCWDPSVMVDFYIPWAASLDILYAIYPATIFWKMRQLTTTRKLAVSILMGLGLISGGVGIYKTTLTHLLERRDEGTDIALASTHILTMWTTIEADFIISAACIPLTRPVWRLMGSYVGAVWKDVRAKFGLGPAHNDNNNERIGQRRTHWDYLELPERISDVNSLIGEGRERHPCRDDFEMQCNPQVDTTIEILSLQRSTFRPVHGISRGE
ncbi:conserved hypothetical protein [Talaromyces marneffei ATCC 18224]|uniref:Rhodopsin domain-containing protein n=2 Tax=Talaromyces marneffei TaxID=37727 RepID=B6QLN4_TALMQ|nr:conserved hypothetical protein [Talaromyces marneffei ATCC 18224]